MATLGSQWGSLSPILLATLYEVDRDGNPIAGRDDVRVLPTEGSIEMSSNWQSPFENMGPESKAPALMAMMQTGMLSSAFLTLTGAASALIGDNDVLGLKKSIANGISSVDQAFSGLTDSLGGVTGMTKLNATQVFIGMAPIKIPLTVVFRAFKDARAEVSAPIDKLIEWLLPAKLSTEGTITGGIRGLAEKGLNAQGLLSVFPSRAPIYVGLRYAGYTFAPLVIESVSHPIVVPRTSAGDPLTTTVQLSLSSITALDTADWRRVRSGKPIAMFQTTKKP